MRHAIHPALLLRVGLVLTVFATVPGAVATEPIAPPVPKQAADATPPDADRKPDSNDGRCDACGGCDRVHTVCVPKPKDREIRKTCWSYRCETVCIPGPSLSCGRRSGRPDECGAWSHESWKPTCAGIVTKKVPVKTEVKRKVPGVEWMPEERCAACRRGSGCMPADARPPR